MGMWSRIKRTFRGSGHDAEIQEELEFHLKMDTANGHDSRQARLRLGNPSRIAEETRAAGIVEWLESMFMDTRYGLRQLRKNPALSLAIVLSLAIGLGANTAIFALADAALLKPLPVRDPDRLVLLEWSSKGRFEGVRRIGGPPRQVEGGRQQIPAFSEAIFRTFAARQSEFASVIAFSSGASLMAVTDGTGLAEQVPLQYVSVNFFPALGVSPILGRSFLEEEDRRGQTPAVIVSHRFWTSRLGGDPNVLGRSLRVNNAPARIVGVAPAGFFGLTIGEWVDLYTPLSVGPAFQPAAAARPPTGGENADWWLRMMARLKPDAAAATAAARETPLFRGIAAETTATELRADLQLAAEPGRRGFQQGVGRDTPASAFGILMFLVGVLLLIICANVANLLLSRAVAQQRESAVRLALGAPRRRLFRQNLIGSGVLAVLGACGGVGLGYVLAQAIHGLFQAGQGAGRGFDLQIDARLLAYTALLCVVTALVFGLAPAVRAARSDVNDSLKVQGRSVIGGRLRLPRLLVSMQLALCFAALVAAGLLGRSLQNLNSIDLGLDAENLSYATLNPYQAGYSAEQVGPYLDRLARNLEAIPGVQSVSVVDSRPLQGGGRGTWATTPDGPQLRLEDGNVNPAAAVNLGIGSANLLETLRVPLLAGRALEPADREGVAVVDQRFAQVFFKGRNPVGQRFTMLGRSTEVIGLAANAHFLDMREETTPTVYMPFDPGRFLPGQIHLAIRAAIGSDQLAAEVRRATASVDRAVPLTEFHTQTGLINRELRTERLLAFLSGGFGLVALTLAAIGLGGLLVYAVARRTNEIGVRMALGAAPANVIALVLRDSLWMIALGVMIGLPGAYAVGGYLKSALYQLQPVDPLTAAVSCGALVTVALLATWIPARRAARIDPMRALREE